MRLGVAKGRMSLTIVLNLLRERIRRLAEQEKFREFGPSP
jgi:hypothetical protein